MSLHAIVFGRTVYQVIKSKLDMPHWEIFICFLLLFCCGNCCFVLLSVIRRMIPLGGSYALIPMKALYVTEVFRYICGHFRNFGTSIPHFNITKKWAKVVDVCNDNDEFMFKYLVLSWSPGSKPKEYKDQTNSNHAERVELRLDD